MRLLFTINCLLIGFLLPGCYVTQVAWHHNNLYNSRIPVYSLLSNPRTSPKLQSKLLFVQEALNFAIQNQLQTHNSYRYFIHNKKEDVSFIVQAADPLKFQSKRWWFPFVGSVPYKGFFDKKQQEALGSQLQAQDWDVYLTEATAFSSLGYFEDPLYSSMLQRSRSFLADTIFHELTHLNIWIPGSVRFNEQLATFVARHLILEFMPAKELIRYEQKFRDRQKFKRWLTNLKSELKALYQSPAQNRTAKLQAKALILSQAISSRPKFERYDYVGDKPWNNARIMAYSLYLPEHQRFERSFKCSGVKTVGEYLQRLAQQPSGQDPMDNVDQFCG